MIKDIKKKKELQSISDSYVKEVLEKYLVQHPKARILLHTKNMRSKEYKKVVKEIRAILRRKYGLFRGDSQNLLGLVSKVSKDKAVIKEILSLHASTKERLDIYEKLYKRIFKITGKPSSIIDLGCGLNPFSLPYMKIKDLKYYAYDLSYDEVKAINSFFSILKIKGKADVVDITKVKLQKADVAFLFKMTDVIDKKGHKETENVLKSIPCKHVVISFPTITMSNKKMNFPRRKWLELLCERLGYEVKLLDFPKELFYVITKNTE